MKIQTLYDVTWKVKNQSFSKWIYKINKLLVNVCYPFLSRNQCGTDSDSNIIVSLTSYPARIETIHLTIRTILNQTKKPNRIILWLAEDQFPGREKDLPRKLLCLKQYGLEILFCDNLFPHKKYYYSMLENPGMDVITIDDDVFYPENMIDELVTLSEQHPDTICCTMGHQFVLDENGDVYSEDEAWHLQEGIDEPTFSLIPTGVGGVYYPAGCLHSEVFNKESIRDCCMTSDDLWLKSMAVLNGKKAVRVQHKPKIYFSILQTQKDGLYKNNVFQNKNEVAWRKIMERYPLCRDILIREVSEEMKRAAQ